MTNKHFFLSMAATALLGAGMTACTSDDPSDDVANSQQSIQFTASVSEMATSRAGSNVQSTSLTSGKYVGLFVATKGASDNSYTSVNDNVKMTVGTSDNTTTLTPSDNSTIGASSDQLYFFAYTPYQESVKLSDGTVALTAAADQSTDENYIASDLLYGAPSSNPVEANTTSVQLQFKHVMSKIIVTLDNSNATDVTISGATVTLKNVVKDATLTLTSGVCAATSEATAGTVTLTSSYGSAAVAGVVAPQTIASGTEFIEVKIGDDTYVCSLSSNQTLASGHVYNYTVKFTATGTVTTATVNLTADNLTAWDESETSSDISSPKKQVTYGVGDYLKKDGTFIAHDDATGNDDNIIGVIFSTKVSETDAAAGYKAYILNFTLGSNLKPQNSGSLKMDENDTRISTMNEVIADLDGRTHTEYVQTLDDYTTNYPLYNLTSFTDLADNNNFSGWFIPSIGQAVQLLNNLGKANIPTTDDLYDTYQYYVVLNEYTSENNYVNVGDGKNSVIAKSSPLVNELVTNLGKYTNGKSVFSSGKRFAMSSLTTHKEAVNCYLMDLATNSISSSTISDNNKTNAWGLFAGGLSNGRDRIVCIAAKSITQTEE